MTADNPQRVVITGLGVLAPNAHGIAAFERALRDGRSGIRFRPELADLGFGCQVAGVPDDLDGLRDRYFDPAAQLGMDRYTVMGCIAGLDCWEDAGLAIDPDTNRLGDIDRLRLRHWRPGNRGQSARADDRFRARAAVWAARSRSA